MLPIRGLLYTLTSNTAFLVVVQVLDGIGAGIFNVVSDLVIAWSVVHHLGFHAGFFFLSAVAAAAFTVFFFAMPETRVVGQASSSQTR